MKKTMPEAMKKKGMDMAFAAVSILHDDVSVTYTVAADDASEEVLRAAVGENAEYDGTSYIVRPYMSRKSVLVPAITDILESYPQE